MTIPPRWVYAAIGLIALLAAGNLFLGGLALGQLAFGGHGPLVEEGVRRFLDTAPEEARPLIRRALVANSGDIAARLRAVAAARQRVAALVQSPALDEAALRQAMGELRARTAEIQALIHELLFQVVRELPPEARAKWQWRWPGPRLSRVGPAGRSGADPTLQACEPRPASLGSRHPEGSEGCQSG